MARSVWRRHTSIGVLRTPSSHRCHQTARLGASIFHASSGSTESTSDSYSNTVPSALKQSTGGKGYGPGVQAWYNNFIQVDPANADHVWVGLEEVYETKDGGSQHAEFTFMKKNGTQEKSK